MKKTDKAAEPLNQARYKILFDKNPAGIYTIALDGTILDCNAAFARIMGFEQPEELVGRNVIEFYYDRTLRAEFLKRIESFEELNNYEIALRKKNGDIAVCLENSFLASEEDGTKTINGAIIDITKDKILSEKYSRLFASSEDGVMFFENGVFTDANPRALDMLGYTLPELLEAGPAGMLEHIKTANPESFDLILLKIEKVIGGISQSTKLNIRRKDGSVFHAHVSFHPFINVDRRYSEIIIRDISERVVFEQTIKESEQRFRTLSKVAIEGIVFTKGNVIIDCNDQIVHLMGHETTKEFLGKNLEDLILHPDLRRLRSTLNTHKTSRTEVRAINREGKVIHMEASGTLINTSDGDVESFLFYDITGRKRIETELERSREQFKSLVENSPNGVWIIVEGNIKYSNSSGLAILGLDEEDDIYGRPFLDFIPEKEKDNLAEVYKKARAGKDTFELETELISRSGVPVNVSINMTLSIYENEPAVQATINNLTLERRLLQEKVRAELAEESNAALLEEIEKHKITQQKLIAAEQFTRNIIDSSIDMIIAVDGDSRITEFNPAALRYFGYTPSEIIGAEAATLYSDNKQFKRILLALQKEGSFRGEIVNKRKDGSLFTSLLSASLIRNDEGTVLGSMGVSRDITELKEAQQKIMESEERLRDIVVNATDFILTLDPEGNIEFANKAFLEAMKYSTEELEGINLSDLTDDKRLNGSEGLIAFFERNKVEIALRDANGSTINVAGNAAVKYVAKRPVRIQAILRDVTKEAEQTAKLNSIFESTENLHMWTLDREYALTGCNKNFLHILKSDFGVDINIGDNYVDAIGDTINPDLYQNQLYSFRQAFDGFAQSFELPLLTTRGESRWHQVFLNPVYIQDELREISCISYDITERKTIDRRIRDALKEKEVLLKEVHHRVKNNLQVISSILSLQTGYVTDPGTLDILRESQNRIKSMSYIHQTLYQTADFSSIEFTEYIDTIAGNLIQSFTVEGGPVKLSTDFDRVSLSLDQAIPCGLIANELISNAMKHAFKGTPKPEIHVAVKQNGNMVTLRVRDNGVGLPANFDYRNYNSLGVQLVYTLAEQLDATVEVSSDKGATFSVTFESVNP
jgi:PAS domain S-box-containing protein